MDEQFLAEMKLFRNDHKPDGYPCIKQQELDHLIAIAEAAREQVMRLNEGNSEKIKHAETIARREVAERCREIAITQTVAPPGAWGKGAKFNADKIARLIKEEYGLSE